MKKILGMILIGLLCFSSIPVEAQTTITVKQKTYIPIDSGEEPKFLTDLGYGYCVTPDKSGPMTGMTLKYVNSTTKGELLYLLENAGTTDEEYLATQLAIWKLNNSYLPNYYQSNPNTATLKKAFQKVAEAEKNKEYQKGAVASIATSSTKLTLTEDKKYYKTELITTKLQSVTEPKLTITSEPKNIKFLNTSNQEITKVPTNGSFYILFPVENITKNVTFTMKLSGKGKVHSVDRYTPESNSYQDLILLSKAERRVESSVSYTLTAPTKRVCEKYDGKYYDKNGNETDAIEYSIQCEKHTCEKVGNTYFDFFGKIVTEEIYQNDCVKKEETKKETTAPVVVETHKCEIYQNQYYGKNGTVVDEATYNSQCVTQEVIVPDTDTGLWKQMILFMIGAAIIGSVSQMLLQVKMIKK